MAQKRTLDSFFTPTAKKARPATAPDEPTTHSTHEHYPFPILDLSPSSTREIASLPARPAKPITSHPDLDLLSFEPYIPPALAKELFTHLRANLPFYRVKYNITRGGIQTAISTPRYTTVFGLDATALFNAAGHPVDAAIAFHSDDERFLGPAPAIASFSLGARRDFLLKHKPFPPPGDAAMTAAPRRPAALGTLRFPLGSGDMLLMRGATQANWLHSGGTENYYHYNVGTGPVYRWDDVAREMRVSS
ncbi:Dihydroxy-acid dehydratase [Verticillium dahliae VDG2]|nr:Dihydroxy-acid dehydratase [Verticillium dahliae VDG2]